MKNDSFRRAERATSLNEGGRGSTFFRSVSKGSLPEGAGRRSLTEGVRHWLYSQTAGLPHSFFILHYSLFIRQQAGRKICPPVLFPG